MTVKAALDCLAYVEPCACVILLLVMQYRRQLGTYKFLAGLLSVRLVNTATYFPLHWLAQHKFLSLRAAYDTYFYAYWIGYAIEAACVLALIYSVYKLAMAPLRGLQALGMLMFRWAAAIAVAVAVGMAFGPHVTSVKFLAAAVSQLQQTQSILTLCMLLFVTLAIRPMGLSYRSKIFGVSLGLGLLATTELVCSAWIGKLSSMGSTVDLAAASAMLAALVIWTTYFALPEPKRRIIVLPTTSPFLRWNQISQALGDNPGFVAVGGIPPEVLAPAEIEIMRRASMKMIMEPIQR